MHFCTFSRISPFFYFLLRFLFHFLFEEPHLSHCVYQIFGDWKMSLEHITWHSLQGKIFLQILVSMAPDTLIRWSAAPLIPSHAIGDHVPDSVISSPPVDSQREAMEMAEKAEKEVLRGDCSLNQVSVQLRLGQQIPQFGQENPNLDQTRQQT